MNPPLNVATDLEGTWHNEHGSELELVLDGRRLAGRFRSGTGLAQGRGSELVGFVSGSLIAFTVNFGAHGSLTSWVGHIVMENGTPRIHANWSMCVELPREETDELWRGTWTGADTFERGPATEERRPPRTQPSHPLEEWR
jgi:hypothetical protein